MNVLCFVLCTGSLGDRNVVEPEVKREVCVRGGSVSEAWGASLVWGMGQGWGVWMMGMDWYGFLWEDDRD
jgi:hypothetical protein